MNLVFVIDQYSDLNNGTTATARRTAQHLIERGHHVEILAANLDNDNQNALPNESFDMTDIDAQIETVDIPFFQTLIEEQGFAFAKVADQAIYKQAFKSADLVHFFIPSPFCKAGVNVARELHIPVSTAFHMQPKNITYSIGMGKNKPANNMIYRFLKRYFYNDFNFIHCPSHMVADELVKHGYEADLRVISNGVAEFFHPLDKAEIHTDLLKKIDLTKKEKPIILLSVGRLSGEKRLDILIDAIKYSKYRNQIYVVIGGQGPKEKVLKKLAKQEGVNIQFGFYEQADLRQLYNLCDLYIHPADAETEGISCMEAITCGAVPIIADSPYSATKEFALTEHSLFEAGDSKALAKQIDYWLDNPNEQIKFKQAYTKYGETLAINNIISEFEKFFQDAIEYQSVHKN
ncbi:MAG: glycosyltransferase family 4 protein [Clostridiaceae bacterium]|nr:glycosyltransferase family 4 protein [Clostridiaceae bacterium]